MNSFLNFEVMNNFVKLNDFVNCYKWKGFLLIRKIKKFLKKVEKNEKDFYKIIPSLKSVSRSSYACFSFECNG